MKRLTTLALIAGLCTVVGLFLSSGLEDVAAAVVSAGWGAAIVVLARAVAVGWAGLGWYVIFPASRAPEPVHLHQSPLRARGHQHAAPGGDGGR